MKLGFSKKHLLMILLLLSISFNIFQYSRNKEYKTMDNRNDLEFKLSIDMVMAGIEDIEENKMDELAAMAFLAKGTSSAIMIYPVTSYYKKNKELYGVLYELDNNITNRTNIREIIKEKNLMNLLPALEKIYNDPIDKTTTEELYNIIRKNTVIQ